MFRGAGFFDEPERPVSLECSAQFAAGRFAIGKHIACAGQAFHAFGFERAHPVIARDGQCDPIRVTRLFRSLPRKLDVADGRVVKGVNFVGLRDAGDPVELACRYSQAGADELVFLDIAASHQGRATLVDMVRRTAAEVTIPFTVGGGISSVDGITELLRAGACLLYTSDAADE